MECSGSSWSEERPNWRQRCVRKMSTSVVQDVLHRELGLPFFSKSGDFVSNGACEKYICRHLMKGRVPDSEETVDRQLDVALVGQQTRNEHTRYTNRQPPPVWFTITVDKLIQVYYLAGLFWKIKQTNTSEPIHHNSQALVTHKEYFQSYLKLYPGRNVSFREYRSIESEDKVVGFEVVSYRLEYSPKVQNATYLISLTKKGLLSAVNIGSLERIKQADSIQLPCYYTPPLINKFADLSVNNETGVFYAMSAINGHAQSLYIITFPPWRVKRIISITVPLRIQLCGSSIVFQEGSHVDLTSIENLIALTEDNPCVITPSPGCNNVVKEDTAHRSLDTRPAPIFRVSTVHGYFGILEGTWPPLYFSKSKLGLQIGRFDLPEPIWTCEIGPFTQFWFQPLPDSSNSAYVTKDTQQFVVTWKPNYEATAGDTKRYKTEESNPFLIDSKRQEEEITTHTLRPRACKSRPKYIEKERTRVLGLSYCDGLDLLAVCTAKGDSLVITLHEPRSFQIFKKFPPISVFGSKRPRLRRRRTYSVSSDDDDDYDDYEDNNICIIDEIRSFNLEMDQELVFIEIRYNDETRIFCLRVLQESSGLVDKEISD